MRPGSVWLAGVHAGFVLVRCIIAVDASVHQQVRKEKTGGKMQSIQKMILKLVVTIALLSSVAFADGEMGGGGLWDNDPSPTKIEVPTTEDGEMGGGGRSANGEFSLDWLISSIGELLGLSD